MLSFFCQKISRYKRCFKLTYIHTLKPQRTSMQFAQLSILESIPIINIGLSYVIKRYLGDFMSSADHKQEVKSDITEAIEKVDAEQVDKNLHQNKDPDQPENLTVAEKTPFIDEQQRTDK